MLYGAKYIIELFDNDEFRPFLVQGSHGFGKSSYANTIMAEAHSRSNGGNPDWKIIKQRIGYTPDEVLDQLDSIPINERWLAYHWDDAGTWLHSLDFQDPFVKAVGKYMHVARTDLACMIFSTISITDVSSKIRGIPDAIIIDITKDGCDSKSSEPARRNRRMARAYILRKTWKGREWKDYQWEEYFDSHVPGNKNNPATFYGWYEPKRKQYAKLQKDLARQRLREQE